jgi:hypothetical protein
MPNKIDLVSVKFATAKIQLNLSPRGYMIFSGIEETTPRLILVYSPDGCDW